MSLRLRFRFDGKCSVHPRYDPTRDGRPQDAKCEGCESLYVIYLYMTIVKRRAENSNCGIARFSGRHEEERSADERLTPPPRCQSTKPFDFPDRFDPAAPF